MGDFFFNNTPNGDVHNGGYNWKLLIWNQNMIFHAEVVHLTMQEF